LLLRRLKKLPEQQRQEYSFNPVQPARFIHAGFPFSGKIRTFSYFFSFSALLKEKVCYIHKLNMISGTGELESS